MRIQCCIYFQDTGRPEQLDASVMANPDNANNANDTDIHTTDQRYNIVVTTELPQSQAGPVFIPPHVRHPLPFSAIAGQLPAAGFRPPPNVDYCPPPVTAQAKVHDGGFNPRPPAVTAPPASVHDVGFNPRPATVMTPTSAYDVGFNPHLPTVPAPANMHDVGFNPRTPTVRAPSNMHDVGFNPRAFSHQFASGIAANDRNILPASSSNVDTIRPIGAPFDNYSAAMFGVRPPISAGSSPKFYRACQPASYPSHSSGFMSRAAAMEFAVASRPWPPAPPDIHRPTFEELYPFQLVPNEASVPRNMTVGSDSLSSGSPIMDLLDHRNSLGNSPTQLPRGAYSTDLLDHRNSHGNHRNSVGNSPTQLPRATYNTEFLDHQNSHRNSLENSPTQLPRAAYNTELLDHPNSHRNSPTQFPRASYACAMTMPSPPMADVMESAQDKVASLPFCHSPIEGLQLSQSLPVGVRFNSPRSTDDAGTVGQNYPSSLMNFDNLSASSPMSSDRSLFQSAASAMDGMPAPSARFQVENYLHSLPIETVIVSPIQTWCWTDYKITFMSGP